MGEQHELKGKVSAFSSVGLRRERLRGPYCKAWGVVRSLLPVDLFIDQLSLAGDDAIPELSVDHDFLDKLKNRVTMARKIDNALHNVKKVNHERNWLKETAEAMELELDPDVFG